MASSTLPSSPPLLPEREPPSSPPLPTASFLPPALPSHTLLRKRHLPEDESLSSDPLFSEDPSEAEDSALYTNPRRKKKLIKGPWWGEAVGTKTHAKVKDKKDNFRNMDSGVFMGSDLSSEMSIDMVVPTRRKSLQCLPRVQQQYQSVPSGKRQPILEVEPIAQQIVLQAVDAGKETFDLSNLALTHLAAGTLAPIRQLVRETHSSFIHPPSEEEFVSLIPEVKLFLAHNNLSRLPPELFHLEHLTVLSLRNNELKELHPAIGRLRRLEELNLAGNSIECLPWELLDFMICRESHRHITVRPNPLLEPMRISGRSMLSTLPAPDSALQDQIKQEHIPENILALFKQHYGHHGELDNRSDLELRLAVGRVMRARHLQAASIPKEKVNDCREELVYLASSAIKFLGVTGASCQRLPPDWAFPVNLSPAKQTVEGEQKQNVPSLFECAVQSTQRNCYLDNLPSGLPDVISNALRLAADAAAYGNPACTTCGRQFVIARAEWVEYWFNGFSSQDLTQEAVLPCKRRACSWSCAKPTTIGGFKC